MFGPGADQPLDREVVAQRFAALAAEVSAATGRPTAPEQLAEGFLQIAVTGMANAIKKISIARGYDVTAYTLQCFGGAGGQHACQVADALGMTTVFVHPLAGVLSAYGMGLADRNAMRQAAIEERLDDAGLASARTVAAALADAAAGELVGAGLRAREPAHRRPPCTCATRAPTRRWRCRWASRPPCSRRSRRPTASGSRSSCASGRWWSRRCRWRPSAAASRPTSPKPRCMRTSRRRRRGCGCMSRAHGATRRSSGATTCGRVTRLHGPAVIAERTATTVLDPGWTAEVTGRDHLLLRRERPLERRHAVGTDADPVMLEVFNNLFMNIAEQMGLRLQNTAYSVNIKERLDFSCALFDHRGSLIANAPHMPVHLGSMGESIRTVIARQPHMKPGDVWMLNDPYHGGTHLPDITVVTPVFRPDAAAADRPEVLFYVASRGHHADVGGTTPGSMPPFSTRIEEEGVLFDCVRLVEGGRMREAEVTALLQGARWPARNPAQNIADLRAQVAANEKGVQELHAMTAQFGLETVRAYMRHVQDNAEESVRRAIARLDPALTGDGRFTLPLDNGARIEVAVRIDRERRSATVDFTGTSAQLGNNFNAPRAVAIAAVLYVFRTLVDDDIPLNDGCLAPIEIIVPPGSMLDPQPPASVVAGNVETSSCVVNAIYGALGVLAGSQPTMNNFTFGSDRHQYYETISGGAGAGPVLGGGADAGFDGASVVQTHMTNSRLTDPEVLEFRFPVRLESYEIVRGSGGAGRWHGGDGGRRVVRFLEPLTASILSNGRIHPAFGLAGGADGAPGRNQVAARRRLGRAARPHRPGRHACRRRLRDRDACRRRLRRCGSYRRRARQRRLSRASIRTTAARGHCRCGSRPRPRLQPSRWSSASIHSVAHR